jgi:hypothetical protein
VIDPDMSRFSRSAHLASWAANSPSNNKPAGKSKPDHIRPTTDGSNRPRHGRARRSPQEEPSAGHNTPNVGPPYIHRGWISDCRRCQHRAESGGLSPDPCAPIRAKAAGGCPGSRAWIDDNDRDRKHTGFGTHGPLYDQLALPCRLATRPQDHSM